MIFGQSLTSPLSSLASSVTAPADALSKVAKKAAETTVAAAKQTATVGSVVVETVAQPVSAAVTTATVPAKALSDVAQKVAETAMDASKQATAVGSTVLETVAEPVGVVASIVAAPTEVLSDIAHKAVDIAVEGGKQAATAASSVTTPAQALSDIAHKAVDTAVEGGKQATSVGSAAASSVAAPAETLSDMAQKAAEIAADAGKQAATTTSATFEMVAQPVGTAMSSVADRVVSADPVNAVSTALEVATETASSLRQRIPEPLEGISQIAQLPAAGIAAAQSIVGVLPLGVVPAGFRFSAIPMITLCPHCTKVRKTAIKYRIGYSTFGVAIAAGFLVNPVAALAPFFFKQLKDEVHYCSECDKRIGFTTPTARTVSAVTGMMVSAVATGAATATVGVATSAIPTMS
ncbi:hypothetical protein GQ42DRAFT_169680 [Ramicandelaber brevisporus]|nr:hypothetical protein GQ42DRAFT_171127 [Ramicandelaber brevisporus]KAI8869671.1 hypothetical protein GQ42DRAFT_169680 [Ramicandelaber brevisporus]